MNDNEIIALEQLVEKYPWYSLAHLELYKNLSERGPEERKRYLQRAAAFVHSRELLFDIAQIHDSPPNFEEEVAIDNVMVEDVEIAEDNEVVKDNDSVSDNELIEEKDLAEEREIAEEKEIPKEEEMAEEDGIVDEQQVLKSSASVLNFSDDDFFELIPEEGEIVVTETNTVIPGGDYFTRREMELLELDENKPIDKFIAEKPSLLRGSGYSSEPVEVEETDEFVDSGFYTETLARIYAEQGFVKRALDVYAKLILLYPEKSTYFASLVKELKTKNNI